MNKQKNIQNICNYSYKYSDIWFGESGKSVKKKYKFSIYLSLSNAWCKGLIEVIIASNLYDTIMILYPMILDPIRQLPAFYDKQTL